WQGIKDQLGFWRHKQPLKKWYDHNCGRWPLCCKPWENQCPGCGSKIAGMVEQAIGTEGAIGMLRLKRARVTRKDVKVGSTGAQGCTPLLAVLARPAPVLDIPPLVHEGPAVPL